MVFTKFWHFRAKKCLHYFVLAKCDRKFSHFFAKPSVCWKPLVPSQDERSVYEFNEFEPGLNLPKTGFN